MWQVVSDIGVLSYSHVVPLAGWAPRQQPNRNHTTPAQTSAVEVFLLEPARTRSTLNR
jgi:hypothetical protein